jgi:hypothetical protein
MNVIASIAALVAGGTIGAVFGMLQDAARRRNERLQQTSQPKSGWGVMPGSGVRVFYLLLVMILVQVVRPLLFTEGTKWWVSAGIGLGYGAVLFRQLRERHAPRSKAIAGRALGGRGSPRIFALS